jgi:hydroxypyruvate reductase
VDYDPQVLANDPARRRLLLDLAAAALAAVDPAAAIGRNLERDGDELRIGSDVVTIPSGGVILLGLGKASVAMARAVGEILRGVPVTGAVVTNAPGPVRAGIDVIEGGHPLPTPGSVEGGRKLLELARRAGSDQLVITLVSGGGSALAEVPAPGIGLDDIITVNDALIRCGAPITEINAVRKHLSDLKGGKLAVAAGPATMITLVISDVVGNPLDSIASGPTVPDPTTYRDALAIVDGHELDVPDPVRRLLHDGAAGNLADTPAGADILDDQVIRIVADAAAAAAGARAEAEARGVEARIATTSLTGEAGSVGAAIGGRLRVRTRVGVTISAGETTVTVRGSGRGGRNQELALAAGIALEGDPDAVVLSIGTDGIDGPTSAAGGIGDGETVRRGVDAGLSPTAALDDNDAGSYLAATGDVITTGPTGTNVGDLVIALRSAAD